MPELTEADREKAIQIVETHMGYGRTMFDDDPYEGREMDWVEPIAAALAEEREKARAPFRKLVEFYDRHEYSSINVDDLREILEIA